MRKKKWKSKVFMFDMKGSKILLKLVSLCGTQSGKQSYKRKNVSKVFMVDMKAQISIKGLFNV